MCQQHLYVVLAECLVSALDLLCLLEGAIQAEGSILLLDCSSSKLSGHSSHACHLFISYQPHMAYGISVHLSPTSGDF